MYQEISEEYKQQFNSLAPHPMQSWEWGEFRKKTGVTVIRRGKFEGKKLVDAFQLTVHPLPKLPFTIGYLPKGKAPTEEMLGELKQIGKKYKCLFIKLEPDVELPSDELDMRNQELWLEKHNTYKSPHPLFTKYTFQIDLTKSEEELLKQMNQKTRYNVRLAQKRGVTIEEDDSENAFNRYLKLTHETTTRQKFYAHNETYHRLMWKNLHASNITHLLTATYQGKIVVTWVVFLFNDILYYPYGASTNEHREVMASNLMMWEAMKWGKKHGAKLFDLWGALGKNPNPKDPWYGFHRFKEGYGARHVELIGSWDVVINPTLYKTYNILNTIRWLILRVKP